VISLAKETITFIETVVVPLIVLLHLSKEEKLSKTTVTILVNLAIISIGMAVAKLNVMLH